MLNLILEFSLGLVANYLNDPVVKILVMRRFVYRPRYPDYTKRYRYLLNTYGRANI